MMLSMLTLFRLLIVLGSLFIVEGCFVSLGKIERVDQPKEEELRANWKDYNTYCLENFAMLFQLKGDKTIQKSDDWREITSGQAASRCASPLKHASPVLSLHGENEEEFGFLIHEYNDGVSAVIIDPKTIRLFYHLAPRGGP
jgi:hypothetical protein